MVNYLALNIFYLPQSATKVKTPAKALTLLLIVIVSLSLVCCQGVNAQTAQPTLAETINNILSNIHEANSSWNVIYDQIFCRQNTTVYDNAITQALNKSNYQEVIFIARLAELNGYSSQTVNACLKEALENMPMCGSLPQTHNGNSQIPASFILYDRYMVNAYRYAQELGVSGWDINSAFEDLSNAYLVPPKGSESGEMLWINPQENKNGSFTSRYYDEHAETLSVFLLLALNGVSGAMPYADDAWLGVQSHWNGSIYGYNNKDGGVECEMGNFAIIITQYQNSRGLLPYYDRVIADLEETLLTNQYNSSAWSPSSVGVIRHASSNNQSRLYETLGNLMTLQMLYPDFTEGNQTNFQDMLQSGWQGLVNSSLFSNDRFRFFDSDNNYNDDASILGAMTLFLYGIIPGTGSLAITAQNERYQDYLTNFQTSQWRFNYTDQSIRLPINKGNLTFIFGSQNVTADFPQDGVYDIQFSSDWNTITQTTKIEDITHPNLQPVTIEPLPTPTPTPTTPPPTVTPSPSPSPSPSPTTSPSPTPIQSPTTTPTTNPTEHSTPPPNPPILSYVIIALSASTVAILAFGILRFLKARSKRQV
ncbi:MAG: hypothetical protein ACQCN6_13460 [Candidatus Bathyarchaeia archaeon]|jgi:hypothetical protein